MEKLICKRPSTGGRVSRPVVALGYQAPDGTIVVTDVLCTNFPEMTDEEAGALSWKLDQWSRQVRTGANRCEW